jgi:Domain of unknown function (DUF4157)
MFSAHRRRRQSSTVTSKTNLATRGRVHAVESQARSVHCPCAGGCPRCASSQSLDRGQPLDAGVRRTLEASYHADLSGVRVHTGPTANEAARRANALALTVGSDIVFGRDQYAPQTLSGFERIAHEVAHTLQQQNGRGRADARSYARAEREATSSAGAVIAGRRAAVSMQTAGMVQRQEAGPSFRPFTSQPEFQLHLDPEIEAMMLQNYVRWWVSSSITEGEPAAESGEAAGGATGETTTTQTVPAPHQLPPNFFERYDPATLGVEPDIGAILAPYNARNVPLGARDVDAATTIFRQNYAFVNALPDIRAAAPSFIRPLIPGHWRRSMAEAFTAATLNAQLRHDFPTPLEAADLSFYRMTGVSTTYIPIPGFSF